MSFGGDTTLSPNLAPHLGERPYVGHAPLREQIARGFDDASGGRGRLFLLMGEPGVGKTRLCDEVTANPARQGVPVLWGRSWESGGAPAYWPWLDVLAGLGQFLDDQDLEETLGEGAPLVGELVPAIRRRLRHLPDGAPPPAEEARFRLWRTVVALVRRAAAPAGLVLVLDDLHSADRASLMLLLAVARELRSMRVLLLATCRDVEARLDPQAGALIGRIGREGETLALARLDRAAVGELLRRRVTAIEPDIETRIFDRTQGNPLFLEEMLRLLNNEGPAAITAGVVPAGVRDVIRQRLEHVSDQARTLLDLVAVAGDEAPASLLALASGREPAWIDTTIAEAERAGVIVVRAGRIRFAHALVREVLYGDLKTDARRVLHGVLGRAIERVHSGDSTLPLMELAHHALEGPVEDLTRAVEFTERAATRAMDLAAAEEAIAILERAGVALAAAGNAPPLHARLLLALGETRIRAGQSGAGTRLCVEVAALARTLGDADLLARAAITYGRVFTFAESDPVMVSLLEEALEALAPGDSASRARLLARLGAALQPSLTPEEPIAVAREAIATARRLGDPRVLLETLHDGLSALMDIVDPRERRALNLEVEALALRLGDRERLLRTHGRLVIDALALGDLAEADDRILAFEALATALRAPWILWRAPLFRAVRATMQGRFADAEQEVERARSTGGSAPDPGVERAIALFQEGFLRTCERHEEMMAHEARTRRERAAFRTGSVWQALAAALTAVRLEDASEVRRQIDLLPSDLDSAVTGNLFMLFCLAEPAAMLDSTEVAARLHPMLLPYADQCVMLGMSAMQWLGPVTRLLALLETRLQRWDEACAHFEDAIARARRLEAAPYLARTQYEYARTLLARGQSGDEARARELLGAARALAVERDMPGLIRLVDARLGPAEEAVTTAATTATAAEAATGPVTMMLEGEYWTLTVPSSTPFRLKDSLGLQYLACLLAEPGREIHVLDLVASGGPATGADAQPVDTGDAGELLDEEARAEYRQRLESLRETLAEAESFGDPTRAARAREEIEFLGAELGRAVGLGGRVRRTGGAAERARSAVQRRIKNALQRIGEASPELARSLARSVRTGNFCEFRPGPPEDPRRSR